MIAKSSNDYIPHSAFRTPHSAFRIPSSAFILHPSSFSLKRAGFTLIELMVALALSVFVMSLFTTLFVQATNSMTKMRGITAVDRKVRSATTVIRQDLSNVLILTKAGQVQPHRVFRPDIPESRTRGGYFLIEENSPAIRQGVDHWGLPVEIDTDDVLAFTVGRKGENSEDIYFGRAPRWKDMDRNGIPDIAGAGYLDDYGVPQARFDKPNNGLTTTKSAEIIYFLRPEEHSNGTFPGQYLANEVRGHNRNRIEDQGDTTEHSMVTPTYTLYRRQLLILPEDVAQFANTLGVRAAIEDPVSKRLWNYYELYDVAAKPVVNPTSSDPNPFMHFVTMEEIDERRFRYGLDHDALFEGRDFPYSWSTRNTDSSSMQVFDLVTMSARNVLPQWLGRPTSLESNVRDMRDAQIGNIFDLLSRKVFDGQGNIDSGIKKKKNRVLNMNGVINKSETFLAVDRSYSNGNPLGYRNGGDVLLRNVLSFDVKVFDDDPRDELSASLVIDRSNPPTPIASPPTPVINSLRTSSSVPPNQHVQEFVDLGYIGTDDGFSGYYADVENATFYSFAWAKRRRMPFGYPSRWRHWGRVLLQNPQSSPLTYKPINTYDTWSDNQNLYEIDPVIAQARGTMLRPIPYAKPLSGIQIKLRILEPRSGLVREVTIVHKFKD